MESRRAGSGDARDIAAIRDAPRQRDLDVGYLGRRYGHIFDPRSDEPAKGICQVSVIAPTATDSDALTKPAFLLPRDSVQALFEKRDGVHVIRIEGPCDHGVVWTTPWSAGVFERD